jgi:hypothetical protein
MSPFEAVKPVAFFGVCLPLAAVERINGLREIGYNSADPATVGNARIAAPLLRCMPQIMKHSMNRQLSLSALREVAILFPGDLHELGAFLLKAYDARDREANARNSGVIIGPSRPTLHGLAAHYAHVTNIDLQHVEGRLVEAGFDLGAIIEYDSPKGSDPDRPVPARANKQNRNCQHEAQA